MGFLDDVVVEGKPITNTISTTGGFLDNVQVLTPKQQEIALLQKQARLQQQEAQKMAKPASLAVETAKDVGVRGLDSLKTFWNSLTDTYKKTPTKIAEDIKAGAHDIQTGRPVVGVLKLGLRTSGDAAIAIFAPISAAIGAALQFTGGDKLIDKTSNVIADKSGITDWEAFQKFAVSHPNAGEDFERILMLLLAKTDSSKIETARTKAEVKSFANKLVLSESPVKAELPKGGFLDSVKVEPKTKSGGKVIIEDIKPPAKVTARLSESAKVDGKPVEVVEARGKPSKVGLSIEARAIEKKLTEGFGGTAEFDTITLQGQEGLFYNLMKSKPESVSRMIRGEEPVPSNLRAASIIHYGEKYALENNNVQLLRDLAKSPLASEISISAQEMRIARERYGDSPVKLIQDIQKVRETRVEKSTKKQIKQVKEGHIKEMKSYIEKSASKRPTWEQFINEIKCNY